MTDPTPQLRKPSMFKPVLALVIPVLLLGCATFPEVERAENQFARPGVEPQLVPIEGLIAQAEAGRATVASRDALAQRAARLRARAAAMRGPVHSQATRDRLAAAIRTHPQRFN